MLEPKTFRKKSTININSFGVKNFALHFEYQFKIIELIFKRKNPASCGVFYGAPEEIRTPGLLIRSQTLYPAELRVHPSCGYGFEMVLAERERFELSVQVSPYDGLANRWFKPLTHLSKRKGPAALKGYFWRRVRDSNPRWSHPHNSFQDCRFKPLSQPS
jgi:hypothetical protein